MKMQRISVSYWENCGGMLRNLACGFGRTIKNLADIEMYEDLRERIFMEGSGHRSDSNQSSSR